MSDLAKTPGAGLGAVGWILLAVGAGLFLNGVVMLFDSVRWFGLIASDTGHLNVHLVRDVGEAYATTGVALLWGALRPGVRGPLVAVAATFLSLHALGHVYETAVGELPHDSWLEDLPGVYLPAVLVSALAIHSLRAPATEAS